MRHPGGIRENVAWQDHSRPNDQCCASKRISLKGENMENMDNPHFPEIDKIGDDWGEPELEEARKNLLDEKEVLEEEIDSIKSQLQAAKARSHETGQYANSVWFQRASDALRHKKRRHQRIQTLMGVISRRFKALGIQKRNAVYGQSKSASYSKMLVIDKVLDNQRLIMAYLVAGERANDDSEIEACTQKLEARLKEMDEDKTS